MSSADTAPAPRRRRGKIASLTPAQRSAVTNGTALYIDGDGNSAWSRCYRDLVAAYASDLGGWDDLTSAQRAIVRRIAYMDCELEEMEGSRSKSEPVDFDRYARNAVRQRNLLDLIGLERRPKEVTDIVTYVRLKAEQEGGE
jgi:hypothetical protein